LPFEGSWSGTGSPGFIVELGVPCPRRGEGGAFDLVLMDWVHVSRAGEAYDTRARSNAEGEVFFLNIPLYRTRPLRWIGEGHGVAGNRRLIELAWRLGVHMTLLWVILARTARTCRRIGWSGANIASQRIHSGILGIAGRRGHGDGVARGRLDRNAIVEPIHQTDVIPVIALSIQVQFGHAQSRPPSARRPDQYVRRNGDVEVTFRELNRLRLSGGESEGASIRISLCWKRTKGKVALTVRAQGCPVEADVNGPATSGTVCDRNRLVDCSEIAGGEGNKCCEKQTVPHRCSHSSPPKLTMWIRRKTLRAAGEVVNLTFWRV